MYWACPLWTAKCPQVGSVHYGQVYRPQGLGEGVHCPQKRGVHSSEVAYTWGQWEFFLGLSNSVHSREVSTLVRCPLSEV